MVLSIGLALALICLWLSLRAGRRKRLIENLPTSKTTGVFIGQVELKGTAETPRPLTSYLAGIPCVYYTYDIEEHWSRTVTETYTDSDGKRKTRTRHESGWKTVANDSARCLFFLRDDCGVVRVDPRSAKIEPISIFHETVTRSHPLYYGKGPSFAVSDSDHRRRFTEQAVPLHHRIYINGPARERKDIVAAEIRYAKGTPMFLISTRTEERIVSGLGWQFWLFGLLGLFLAGAGYAGPFFAKHHEPATCLPLTALFVAGALLMWCLGWVWMVYNSLVNLRQRVRQAWANVDVQLKRRRALIPNLVRVITGLRDHERNVYKHITTLRAQLEPTEPGEDGPDPEGCTPHLLAIVERYPELKSNEAFLDLQRSLADTEQRIALARGYFNNIATFHNTRLETIPDRWVAGLARLKPRPLITASGFERAPVKIELDDDDRGPVSSP